MRAADPCDARSPAVAILVDYIFYGQSLTVAQFAGIALIMFGSFAVNLNLPLLPGRAPKQTPDAR